MGDPEAQYIRKRDMNWYLGAACAQPEHNTRRQYPYLEGYGLEDSDDTHDNDENDSSRRQYEYIQCDELLCLAQSKSNECLEFLLEAIKYPATEDWDIRFKSWLPVLIQAITGGNIEAVDMILDRPQISQGVLFDMGICMFYRALPARMAEHLIRRGYKPAQGTLNAIYGYGPPPWWNSKAERRRTSYFNDNHSYVKHRMDRERERDGRCSDDGLCDVLVKQGGLDVDACTYKDWYRTALFEACGVADEYAIEALLKSGANPNGIERPDGIERNVPRIQMRKTDFCTRPIDQLFLPRHWLDIDWKSTGTRMYKCISVLIEHGASTSRAKFVGDPVRTFLECIWRLLCPWLDFKARCHAKDPEMDESSEAEKSAYNDYLYLYSEYWGFQRIRTQTQSTCLYRKD
ncbi:hypothetical protein M426DRAFT_13202 [Hypoxylon sp. CI-4A]|nr:hypothetical protein M426DRAFT_13202 [Hypoxylon sp. CI-4A]